MFEKVEILGVHIANLNMQEVLSTIQDFMVLQPFSMIFTPNAEIIMAANRNPELKKILNSAQITVPDGAGVIIASKILATPLKERVAGFDLINAMFNSSSFSKYSYYLFGAKPEVVSKTAQNLIDNYGLRISGYQSGYYNQSEEDRIIDTINSSGADILLVALGAPKQEFWIYKNAGKLNVKLCIGVGGSFDVLSGYSSRAPEFFQKNNLEWLYRLGKEPRRFFRMLDLPRFMIRVLRHKFKKC